MIQGPFKSGVHNIRPAGQIWHTKILDTNISIWIWQFFLHAMRLELCTPAKNNKLDFFQRQF